MRSRTRAESAKASRTTRSGAVVSGRSPLQVLPEKGERQVVKDVALTKYAKSKGISKASASVQLRQGRIRYVNGVYVENTAPSPTVSSSSPPSTAPSPNSSSPSLSTISSIASTSNSMKQLRKLMSVERQRRSAVSKAPSPPKSKPSSRRSSSSSGSSTGSRGIRKMMKKSLVEARSQKNKTPSPFSQYGQGSDYGTPSSISTNLLDALNEVASPNNQYIQSIQSRLPRRSSISSRRSSSNNSIAPMGSMGSPSTPSRRTSRQSSVRTAVPDTPASELSSPSSMSSSTRENRAKEEIENLMSTFPEMKDALLDAAQEYDLNQLTLEEAKKIAKSIRNKPKRVRGRTCPKSGAQIPAESASAVRENHLACKYAHGNRAFYQPPRCTATGMKEGVCKRVNRRMGTRAKYIRKEIK